MRRAALSWMLALFCSPLLAQTAYVPLARGVIHRASAPSPTTCTYGSSPDVITDDNATLYTCIDGSPDAYTAVATAAPAALAANGANCSAGEFPLGVDASGAVESCTVAFTAAGVPAAETDAAHDNCSEITGCVVGAITAAGVPAAETDAAHDACSEISGCVVGALAAETDPGVPLLALADYGDVCAANQVVKRDGTDTSNVCATLTGGGDALTTNPLSQFAATTSAQLAGVLSDETGTGKAVFGTAPNLIGPVTIEDPYTTFKMTLDTGALDADHLFYFPPYDGVVVVDGGVPGAYGVTLSSDPLASFTPGYSSGGGFRTYSGAGSSVYFQWAQDATLGKVDFSINGGSTPEIHFDPVPTGPDLAYDATTWNNSTKWASRNAVRDKIESMDTCAEISGCVPGALTSETQHIFQTVDAPAGTDPVADSTTDTLTLTASGSLTITGDSATDTLAFAVTETDAAHDACSEISGCVVGAITAAGVPAAETDAAHDNCSEITGCVPGAITSYTETQTLDNVLTLGATSSTVPVLNGGVSLGTSGRIDSAVADTGTNAGFLFKPTTAFTSGRFIHQFQDSAGNTMLVSKAADKSWQFGGTSLSGAYLAVAGTIDDTLNFGIDFIPTWGANGGGTVGPFSSGVCGGFFGPNDSTSTTATDLVGGMFVNQNVKNRTHTNIAGAVFQPAVSIPNSATTTHGNVYGFYVKGLSGPGAGTGSAVTAIYGGYIGQMEALAKPVSPDTYGLYIAEQAYATNNYGLFLANATNGYKAIAIRDTNVWIGSNAAGQLDLNGTTVKVNGNALSGANTGDQTCATVSGCVPSAITAAGVPAAETDAAHDTCAEISGCVVGAITTAVTSVATTAPITGGPITTTGTIACATCTTNAAALTANALVIGGGSQATSALGSLGTTTTVLHGNAGGAPTFGAVVSADVTDGTIALADMADLAQDQFIGRTTASTGVPQTATITTAARTVLDDTTVGAMVDTIGGATASGTGGLVRRDSPVFTTTATGVTETFADADTSVATTGFVAAAGPTYARVSGSDATRAGTSVDVTGLTASLTTGRTYEFEAVLMVTSSEATNGNVYAVNYTSTASLIEALATGTLAAATTQTVRISVLNTNTAKFVTVNGSGGILIRGIITTTGTGTFSIMHGHLTSGTSTVRIGSFLKVRRIA